MLHTPHVASTPDLAPQLMTEDLTTRAFFCKVEGCGRTLVGLFQFATHEKYFHKLAASERASQCFMHSCPIAPCPMEYVRHEDLQAHIKHAHPTAVPLSRPGSQKPKSESVSPLSQEPNINTLVSRSNSHCPAAHSTPSNSSSSLGTADVKISERVSEPQHIEKQLANVLGVPDRGNFKGGRGGKPNEKKPTKVQPKVQTPTLPCPHVHCTNSFFSQSLLEKHIAKRHKRGVKCHVVPGVAILEPPFAYHDQTPLEPQSIHSVSAATPGLEGGPSIVSPTPPAIAAPSQTAPDVHVQGRGEDLLTQVPNNSGTVESITTSSPNQCSQQRANQPSQQQTSSPSICPFPNCGQAFRKVRQRDRHLCLAHFPCPAPSPAPGPVLTEPDLLLPKGPAAGTPVPAHSSKPAPVSGFSDQKDIPHLLAARRIPAQNLHSRDVLTCPVHGCSEIFGDLKSLLVHGRDLHGLLDTPGLDTVGPRPAPNIVPASTGPVVASGRLTTRGPDIFSPLPGGVSRPNPSKPDRVVAKPIAAVPPMNLSGSSVQNQERTGPKSMRCLYPGCNSMFTRAIDFRYHEKNIHGLTASGQCASMYKVHCHSCQKSYWTQEDLDRHVLEKHLIPVFQPQDPGPIPARQVQAAQVLTPKGPRDKVEPRRGSYRCELCRLDFPTAMNLNYHQTKSSYHRSLMATAATQQARAKGPTI
ncbi:hypothetical protein EV426DRAFT_703608 [Tirmania nivea]|nr:hypothetical protein EV426DRAFT_703608 [Tirmania nivea]